MLIASCKTGARPVLSDNEIIELSKRNKRKGEYTLDLLHIYAPLNLSLTNHIFLFILTECYLHMKTIIDDNLKSPMIKRLCEMKDMKTAQASSMQRISFSALEKYQTGMMMT